MLEINLCSPMPWDTMSWTHELMYSLLYLFPVRSLQQQQRQHRQQQYRLPSLWIENHVTLRTAQALTHAASQTYNAYALPMSYIFPHNSLYGKLSVWICHIELFPEKVNAASNNGSPHSSDVNNLVVEAFIDVKRICRTVACTWTCSTLHSTQPIHIWTYE